MADPDALSAVTPRLRRGDYLVPGKLELQVRLSAIVCLDTVSRPSYTVRIREASFHEELTVVL